MSTSVKSLCLAAAFFSCSLAGMAQELSVAAPAYKTIADIEDPVALIGMSIGDVLAMFGPPRVVYASRGSAEWQDDVVFEYAGIDFYVYRDRVWQVSPSRTDKIRLGDPQLTVVMVYGEAAIDKGSYFITGVPERAWKIEIRYNIDAKGKVSAIYIYRADY
ncbi:MAG: hypothetical protein LBT01_00380 [Spirochaetaceae bacterium]|jgi:hypothetical protein|nr:hypothetical protein [Spirochaetaceae bacterium]